jgi:hypothetical protein
MHSPSRRDLDIGQVNVSMVVTKVCLSMWGCGRGDPYACALGEVAQATGGGMAVHPCAAAVEQDRAVGPVRGGAVDGAADRRWLRDQDDFGAFAAHAQDAVAVFLAEVGDVGAGGFEDSQAQQPEHGHQGEVVVVA